MWAVVEIDKKQYIAQKGDTLQVQLLKEKEGQLLFDKVLLVVDGEKVSIGAPYVKDAQVKAEHQGQTKGEKVVIYKFKRRKKYRRKQGHRQNYTLLKISDIIA